ncbi:MAG: MBL fold metallo-hydrolase [Bacteroidota bacterium]
MNLTITGYSTALFSTWFFVDELGILFDVGDGASAGLLQKARRVKHVFVSHADRDHLTGLFQFNQLNARNGFPVIHFPKDCGSFPYLADFTSKFDPHVGGTGWNPLAYGDTVQLKKGLEVEAIRNNHVPAAEELSKSLTFRVWTTRTKLKDEYLNLPGKEIKALREKLGEAEMTYQVRENVLTYSGDTPVDDFSRYDGSKVLIHEATFLGGNENIPDKAANKHSTLEEVLEMVAQIKIGMLILSHFSTRYAHDKIDDRIRLLCEKYKIGIPVYRVLPGQIHRDILNEKPIWEG